MKQIVGVFLFFLSSTLFAQEDTSGNYAQIDFKDSLLKINITHNKDFLFSDSTFRYPNYQSIPSSVLSKVETNSKKQFHFSPNKTKPEFLNIFQVKHSETFLFYQIGSANSQNLHLAHLQRMNEKISLWAEYDRNKSDGFYLNQQGKSEDLKFYLNYNGNSGKYNLKPYFLYQNFIANENGGIKEDSLFNAGGFDSPTFLETHLSSAKNTRNNIQGGLHQKFLFKSKILRIYSDFGYSQQRRIFTDDLLDSYYDTLYLDTILTNDLYKTERYHNELTFFYPIKNTIHRIGIRNEFLQYKQNTFDTTSFENKAFLKSQYHWKKSWLFFDLDYAFTGFNTGNFSSEIKYQNVNQSIFSKIKLQSNILLQAPEILYFRMNGNHFQWHNSLEKSFYLQTGLCAESKFGSLTLNHEMIDQFVFLDENIEVVQTDISIQRIEISYNYILDEKKIHWRNDLIYQNVFSGDEFYRVPDLILRSDFRFKTKLKAMDLQIGLVGNYRTSYYANAYDPALGTFHLQNELKTGNYPILDFFILSRIKTVDLKFTLAHFNSGFTGQNYYAAPLYPIAPRAFYFGLSWHLKD